MVVSYFYDLFIFELLTKSYSLEFSHQLDELAKQFFNAQKDFVSIINDLLPYCI